MEVGERVEWFEGVGGALQVRCVGVRRRCVGSAVEEIMVAVYALEVQRRRL